MKSLVAVVRNEDPYKLVRNSLELADVRRLVKPEQKILIKPNLVGVSWDSPYFKSEGVYGPPWIGPVGYMTRSSVMDALIRALKELGCKHIAIAEGSGDCETTVAFKASGFCELAEHHGIDLIDLNHAPAVKVPVPANNILEYVWIPKILFELDFLIDLTTLKVHGRSAVSLCLKNWGMGVPPAGYYGFAKMGSRRKGIDKPLPVHRKTGKLVMGQEVALAKVIVDVCKTVTPHLGIIDAITTVHYAQPIEDFFPRTYEKTIAQKTNLMIVGTDIVAVDAVACRIVGIDPRKVLHIKLAADEKIGAIDPSSIEIKGETLDQSRVKCNVLLSQKEILLQ
jgi:uncharacterized protein (DUF362 family)